jgi:hypothetical protein
VYLDHRENQVLLDHKGHKVYLDHRENQVLLDHKDHRAQGLIKS